jgi:hypothetical protein
MATQYTGDRTAVEIPSALPADGVSPIGVIPDDGDDLNVSSILQLAKVCLDFIDYLTHRFTTIGNDIDAKIGTLSGALDSGTITASNGTTPSYRRQQCLPNSTDKTVCFRLSLPYSAGGSTQYYSDVTLSGGAAFGTGADGVIAHICDLNGHGVDGDNFLMASVSSAQVVHIAAYGIDSANTNAISVEVQIRGH